MGSNTRGTRRISWALIFLCLLLAGALLGGCSPAECKQMTRCCAAIQDMEGVGDACGKLSAGLDDADACLSVIYAAEAMFEARGDAPPQACMMAGND